MSTQAQSVKPILGLFANEDELKNYIAVRLDLIEPGLTLVKTEYSLDNPDGSGGRIDILARDTFGHLVCIEIKRSDNSARGTLNELSKYVTLLVNRDRVPREMIRCIVVSTHWSELLLPLSYFAYSTGVDVIALRAELDAGEFVLRSQTLATLRFLPQLSPDMDLIWFEALEPRQRYVDLIRIRAESLRFVRLAVLLFEPILPHSSGRMPYPMMVCVWRVPDGRYDQIEAVIGTPIGSEFPYAAPGWEPESDAKYWILDLPPQEIPEVAAGWTHGTPEKLHALQPNYRLSSVERVGDWPKLEFINDDEQILTSALAASPLGGTERANRHSYKVTVTPRVVSSWQMAVNGFLAFIAFEPTWHSAAETYLKSLVGHDVSVELHAFDKKHLVYAIHQARFHEDAMLGYFEIIVSKDGAVSNALRGYYTWDGETCPADAEKAIEQIYGTVTWARLSIGSAVDDRRYEAGNALHGILPVVDWLDESGIWHDGPPPMRRELKDFVAANYDYCRQVSEVLERMGSLPTDPSA
jgi:hypothetical protein